MNHDDCHYLQQRAEEHLDLAQQATHPAATKAHYDLLNHYLDRLYPAEETPQADEAAS